MQSEQEIEYEIVTQRWFLIADPLDEEECIPQKIKTAIPLRNVLSWEACDSDWHDNAPVERITIVTLLYETKYVEIPFDEFHEIMKIYRKDERERADRRDI
jgi:hypothetical protein